MDLRIPANRQIEEDRSRNDRNLRDAHVESNVVFLEPAHGAGRRVEPERASAGEDDGVHLIDHVQRVEQIGLARSRCAASDLA